MTRTIRVLHLEDDPYDAEIIAEKLGEGMPCDIVRVDSKAAFEAALARESFDLVLCDYNLPGYNGIDAVTLVREHRPDLPVLVISGTVGEEDAVECLHLGATDYLLKDRLDRLAPAAQRALEEAEERQKRREAEAALRASEERYRLLMDMAPDAILIFDAHGRIQMVNMTAERLFGFDRAELGSSPVESLVPGVLQRVRDPQRQDGQPAMPIPQAGVNLDMVARRRDGTEIPVEISYGASDIAGEHLVICVIRDITVRRNLEGQLRQAQRVESLGQLAGGVAHDFNNLLTVINGMSDLLLGEVEENSRVFEDVKEIRNAGERAAALTRQLLAFSRQQVLEPRVITFNTVITDMEGLLRRVIGEDIDMAISLAPDPGFVKADPGQIEQVITNLAVNARDAMPKGGQLTLGTEKVEIDEHYARQHAGGVRPGPYAVLTVSDSGTGIDEPTRSRIFEPFFTTKGQGKGTGLGLSTVYGIVKQSEGFIWVYSEIGKGTTFKILLPRVAGDAEPARSAPNLKPTSGTETILLVEDNEGLREVATRFLEAAGYTVLPASSGEEALGLLERGGQVVHLMVTDVVMPGISGRSLAEQIAQTRPAMKVLYVSGYAADAIVRRGVLEGHAPFLTKPFAAAELCRKVREVLDS